MNTKDKLQKCSWVLLESVKDALASNVVLAINNNLLKVDNSEMTNLLTLLNSSVEEGFFRAQNSYNKSVDDIFNELLSDDRAQNVSKKK